MCTACVASGSLLAYRCILCPSVMDLSVVRLVWLGVALKLLFVVILVCPVCMMLVSRVLVVLVDARSVRQMSAGVTVQ